MSLFEAFQVKIKRCENNLFKTLVFYLNFEAVFQKKREQIVVEKNERKSAVQKLDVGCANYVAAVPSLKKL